MQITIGGIPYEVIKGEDTFTADGTHFGQIDYSKAKITINKTAAKAVRYATLMHEVVHGLLVAIGREDLSRDETLVQSLSTAMLESMYLKLDIDDEVPDERDDDYPGSGC